MQDEHLVLVTFTLLSILVGSAGYFLSLFAEIVAEKTKMGRSIAGIVLLATVTSLPELTSGISAVTNTNHIDLAIGDVLGSCAFNLSLIFLIDVFYRNGIVYSLATNGHILSGAYSLILLCLVGLQIAYGKMASFFSFGGVTLLSWTFLPIYFLAIKSIYKYQSIVPEKAENAFSTNESKLKLITAILLYILATIVILLAGSQLPLYAEKIVQQYSLSASFVGTLFLSVATSLPELAATIGALRLKAIDLALGNLLGSNLFNVCILFIDDVFYTSGLLLYQASSFHLGTIFTTIIMTATIIIAIILPPQKKIFNIVTTLGLAILVFYFFNLMIIYFLAPT